MDCYVFPLDGVDLILCISWLAQFGDVKANWKTLIMEYQVEGHDIVLRGNPSFDSGVVPVAHVYSLSTVVRRWLLWSLD